MRIYPYAATLLLVCCILPVRAEQPSQTEPNVGTWKTWVISGQQFRLPPPPDNAATDKELTELAGLIAKRDQTSLAQIAYWDTGSPSYRWSEIAITDIIKRNMPSPMAMRDLALMHVAIYDAMVAAWDAHAYNLATSKRRQARPDDCHTESAEPIVSRRACGGAGAASECWLTSSRIARTSSDRRRMRRHSRASLPVSTTPAM
jgi:hypothetical protein